MSDQAAQGAGIDPDTLSLDQLSQLKQQEEQKLTVISSNYASLRAAMARYNASRDAVTTLQAQAEDREILVPLTASLYVPGKLVAEKNKKVMVELGTGFYAEKNFSDAIEFIDRKVGLISKNSENLLKVIQGTKKNVENINISMQGKLMQIRARQEGLKHQAANA